jgi:uncharacterized protein (TIGR03032 family)
MPRYIEQSSATESLSPCPFCPVFIIGTYGYDFRKGHYLVRIDRDGGRREDVTFCPGFARGLDFVSHYAVVTVSLVRSGTIDDSPLVETMRDKGAANRSGLLIIDLRNGDIVQWFWLRGDVTELFEVGVIFNVRCPRSIGPYSQRLEETMRGEKLEL